MELEAIAVFAVIIFLTLLTQSWFRLLVGCLAYLTFMLWWTSMLLEGASLLIALITIFWSSAVVFSRLIRLTEEAEDYEQWESSGEPLLKSRDDHSYRDYLNWEEEKNTSDQL